MPERECISKVDRLEGGVDNLTFSFSSLSAEILPRLAETIDFLHFQILPCSGDSNLRVWRV